MKLIIIIFFFPLIAWGQTVHLNKDEIEYKGQFDAAAGKEELYTVAKNFLQKENGKMHHTIISENTDKAELVAYGTLKLHTAFSLIRTLHYTLSLNADKGKIKYHIDSVYLEEKSRGFDTKMISSEDLVKSMDITGPVAAQTEHLLNEIDMNFQMLLDLLKKDIKEVKTK
ncbi:MAG: hypothetical protein ACJ75B_13445 [Flavisolibacter sp.]|jgi:uncharacterized protein (UPF0335 family)